MKQFFLSLALLTAAFTSAHANADINISQSFVKGDQLIFAEAPAKSSAFDSLVAALEKDGYVLTTTELADSIHQAKTWCRAAADLQQVRGECYAPHPGHRLMVQDSVTTASVEDFSKVIPMLEKIRKEHGDATAMLGIK